MKVYQAAPMIDKHGCTIMEYWICEYSPDQAFKLDSWCERTGSKWMHVTNDKVEYMHIFINFPIVSAFERLCHRNQKNLVIKQYEYKPIFLRDEGESMHAK